MPWYDRAACKKLDTRLFFSSDDEKTEMRRRREAQAKKICSQCTVIDECLQAGINEDGIWGGLTRSERQGARRQKIHLERPLAVPVVSNVLGVVHETDSPWVIIETTDNFAIWQRDTNETWHGAEWAVVKSSEIMKVYDDLSNAYIIYGSLIHS
jgi:WhiB family transcriptional regulator, redox-sensing transcriptional regulator